MHFDTKKLTRCALIAAVYVALTMLSNVLNLAFGPIQLRFSEALTVLPFLLPETAWGLFVGCMLTARCRNQWTAALPPVVCNAVLVGALIAWEQAGTGSAFAPAFAYNALTVGAGEAAACYAMGLPLLGLLQKRAEKL